MNTLTVKHGKSQMECHILPLPQCCPVSHNPLPGSTIKILYRPSKHVLDVLDLPSYIHRFVGGLRFKDGTLDVRDMEHMIQRIADDCCEALGMPVRVYATLFLRPGKQTMLVKARAYFESKETS